MASSRIFQLSSSCIRLRGRSNALPFSPPPLSLCTPHIIRHIPAPFPRFQRLHFFSATTGSSAASIGDAKGACGAHPWPEWDQFVEKIRSKGYFEGTSADSLDDDGFHEAAPGTLGSRGSVVDSNKLKNACLKFARDRFDILRSLPKEDIKAVVERGCPNLFRKSVNSSKRLRAFLRINEADVCSGCNIRGSCDRAYEVMHEEEGARTLDIMRVLLSYAVNPGALLGGENSPVKVEVQQSARKILSEFIKLSDTIINPSLVKPNFNLPKGPSSQVKRNTTNNESYQDVEMKAGDWLCPNCNFLNFSRNVRCLQCKANGPKKVDVGPIEMKPGDWMCSKCDFMNFARNRKCLRCLEQRPARDLNPGDWECPDCDFLNFGRNQVCRKCNRDRPDEDDSASDDHIWKTPGKDARSKDLNYGYSEDEVDDSENERRQKYEDPWPSSSSPLKRKVFSSNKRGISS